MFGLVSINLVVKVTGLPVYLGQFSIEMWDLWCLGLE